MNSINLNDFIFAMNKLGRFLTMVSSPDFMLNSIESSHLETMKRDPKKYDYNSWEKENLRKIYGESSKFPEYYYMLSIENNSSKYINSVVEIKHAIRFIPAKGIPVDDYKGYDYIGSPIQNALFYDTPGAYNSISIIIPEDIFTLNLDINDSSIESLKSYCGCLLVDLVNLLTNNNIVSYADLTTFIKIMTNVFVKKLLFGTDIFDLYYTKSEKIYKLMKEYDPEDKFAYLMDPDIRNISYNIIQIMSE